MKYAIYKPSGLRVKVLGTDEGYYVIEFESGACLNATETELEFED